MALEGFHRIDSIEAADSGYKVSVTLMAGHKIYEGHFPGQPVVPGVCTLSVVRDALSEALGRRIRFDSVKEAKFLAPLIPTSDLQVILDISCPEDGKVKCNIIHNEEVTLKLSASYTDR